MQSLLCSLGAICREELIKGGFHKVEAALLYCRGRKGAVLNLPGSCIVSFWLVCCMGWYLFMVASIFEYPGVVILLDRSEECRYKVKRYSLYDFACP
jgi:hypothetical protein